MEYGKYVTPSTTSLDVLGDSYKYLAFTSNGMVFPVTTNNRDLDNTLISFLKDFDYKTYILSDVLKIKDNSYDVLKLIVQVNYKKDMPITFELSLRTDDNNFKAMFRSLLKSFLVESNLVLPF